MFYRLGFEVREIVNFRGMLFDDGQHLVFTVACDQNEKNN